MTADSVQTTLIVGPVALVRQWETEIKKKIVASHRLSTHLMHGQSKKLSWDEIQTFDVVMTTYGTLAHEFKSMEKWVEKQKAEHRGEYSQVSMRKLFPLLGPKSFFYRVILDEAQSIKNKNTGAAKAACNLKSTYRHCLTGTPMMNNVGELYSLIHFLRIKPYNEWTRFQQVRTD
jgi:SNF2 family DNA or RNA helicase